MKTPSPHAAFAPRAVRGFGSIALVLLFVLAVFELTHPSAASTGLTLVDLWRGLAAGALFLFFCLPTAGRPRS